MATLLSAIINSPFTVSNIETHKNRILQNLKDLKLAHCWKVENPREREEGDWNCKFMKNEDELEYYFSGPFMNSISVYPNGVMIHSAYKLKTLYLNFNLHWFTEYRQELYQIMQIFEGTEMIFLSDGSSPLSNFEAQMIDGKTYTETKQSLQNYFGKPVINYRQLNSKLARYDQVNEWMLEDFADLKSKN